jgi:hypothetical protein
MSCRGIFHGRSLHLVKDADLLGREGHPGQISLRA